MKSTHNAILYYYFRERAHFYLGRERYRRRGLFLILPLQHGIDENDYRHYRRRLIANFKQRASIIVSHEILIKTRPTARIYFWLRAVMITPGPVALRRYAGRLRRREMSDMKRAVANKSFRSQLSPRHCPLSLGSLAPNGPCSIHVEK